MNNEDDLIDISDWAMFEDNGFCRVTGLVPSGKYRTTSRVACICGSLVRTESGSLYRLLKPNDSYRKFCEENNLKIPGDLA